MEKKLAGLVGAVAGLATMGAAHASMQTETPGARIAQASSYAELLGSVPNPVEVLKADDLARSDEAASATGNVQLAQYHHHHHHHHRVIIRRHHHHHHHHRVIIRRHHHHHHHHHGY